MFNAASTNYKSKLTSVKTIYDIDTSENQNPIQKDLLNIYILQCTTMHFFIFSILVLYLSPTGEKQVFATPVELGQSVITTDKLLVHEYATLKHILIYDLGYTEEFADMVEVNLKRAIREEKERQTEHGIVPDRLRQVQASEEDDDDETTAGPTTIGPAPGDIVKGVAMIITSLGTFDVNSFWGSFVNFFPPAHRESAQAVVDASQGRRPLQWPTLPTTTTKLTTTTKDEDEIDSEEITTAAAIAATVASVAASSPAVAVTAPVPVATVATEAPVRVNVAATRPPVSRYTVRPRTSALEGAPGN